MWKDYFYFTKGQRVGIVVLSALVIITFAACYIYPLLVDDSELPENLFLNEALQFEKGLIQRDSLVQAHWDSMYQHKFEQYKSAESVDEKYSLFVFDPNSLDSLGFVKLGLKKYVITNILRFRAKGGKFRTTESFSKVYGLTPVKFNELLPYVVIAEQKPVQKDSTTKSSTQLKQKNIIVELNSADTTELMKVYGIGRGFAKAILRFRLQTGGFVKVEQLKELYGMTDANYSKIVSNCRVDVEKVKKININTASVEKLNAHPYLNFYESKAIYEFRRRKGKIKSIEELRQISELSSETISKISSYFIIE